MDALKHLGEATLFDIYFLGEPPEFIEGDGVDDSWTALRGAVQFGTFREEFLAPITSWDRADFERQWCEAAGRLLRGDLRSAFVTQPLHVWYVAYRRKHEVLLQEHLLGYDESARALTERDAAPGVAPYDLIRPRGIGEPGEVPPSEWVVRLADVAAYVERASRRRTT